MNIPIEGVNRIAVTGNAASGKTAATGMLAEQLGQYTDVFVIKDRTVIEGLVVAECQSPPDGEGWLHGPHSRYKRREDGQIVMAAKDGTLWNMAHQQMLRTASEHRRKDQLLILEYAIAPNFFYEDGATPLLQDGPIFLQWARQAQALNELFVLEIDSKFELRQLRDSRRERDAMDPATFEKCFPDGGGMPIPEISLSLEGRFHRMDNNVDNDIWFQGEVFNIARGIISPTIFGEGASSILDRGRRK